MIFYCPTCGNHYNTNFCEKCKKTIEPASNNTSKNAMLTWGLIILIIGLVCAFISIPMGLALQNNLVWIFILAAGVILSLFGLVLLGISAIVDRLNTIIWLIKNDKKD